MEAVTVDSEETVSALLAQGAEKAVKNSYGQTALDLAVKGNNKRIQTLLR